MASPAVAVTIETQQAPALKLDNRRKNRKWDMR
jgi:hypothetical protein